jgi:hypothetical protein
MKTSASKTKNAIEKATPAPNLSIRKDSMIYSYNKTRNHHTIVFTRPVTSITYAGHTNYLRTITDSILKGRKLVYGNTVISISKTLKIPTRVI